MGIPSDAWVGDVDPSALVASGGEADVAEHMENMHEEEADNQVRSWAASSWPDFSQLSDNCATCGLEPGDGVRFLKCASCLTPRYCSKQCQTDGWKQSKHGHKFSCAAKLGLPTPASKLKVRRVFSQFTHTQVIH